MKLSQQFFVAAIAASSLHGVAIATNPCEEEDLGCIPVGKPCLGKAEECCGGGEDLKCAGFEFFMKCVPSVTCGEEWWACDSTADCCEDFVCEPTSHGGNTCQFPKETLPPVETKTHVICPEYPLIDTCEIEHGELKLKFKDKGSTLPADTFLEPVFGAITYFKYEISAGTYDDNHEKFFLNDLSIVTYEEIHLQISLGACASDTFKCKNKDGLKLDEVPPDPDAPAPRANKCVMKRAGRALEYEPNFAYGREDVYVQVEIDNDGVKETMDFFPHNFQDFANDPKKGHIPILDQEKYDKLYNEQTKLGGAGFRFRFFSKNGPGEWNSCSYSPIALDLDGSGAVEHITSDDVGFQIDITGDGVIEHLSEWFAPTEGILIDLKEINATDNLADNVTGQHMMGDMGGLHGYEDGFDKLATYDDDQDGKLSGAELDGLYLWVDANSNLLIDQGELETVTHYNITALYTNHSTTFQSHADLADGTTMLMQDLWFDPFANRRRTRFLRGQ